MNIKQILKKNTLNISIIICIFFLDRVSKILILDFFKNSTLENIYLTSFLNLNLLWNKGVAFGLLHFEEKNFYNFITIIIFIVLCAVSLIASKNKGLKKISYLMILGGGLGNFFDRLYYGSVIDFIDFNYRNFHWFIFNVADIFITIGILFLILLEFKK